MGWGSVASFGGVQRGRSAWKVKKNENFFKKSEFLTTPTLLFFVLLI